MIFKLNPEKIRKDFDVLSKDLIYFDSACMSLKPNQVVDKINEYYKEYPACAGRSAHALASRVDDEVTVSRGEISKLINSKKPEEIIFTKNTTESINLVSKSLGLKSGDEVIVSDKEHNSNLIPWLRLKKIGVKIIIVKSNSDNTFNLDNFSDSFTPKTKLVSLSFVSNLDGVSRPIKEIAKITHENSALLLVDGAQAVPSRKVDVRALDIDFLAFSGHKMLGPTGTGILYGKFDLLEKLDLFISGGETVFDSTYSDYSVEKIPHKFEAGLQNYAGIIGLGAASKYLRSVGLDKIHKHEVKLNSIMTEELGEIATIIGPEDAKLRSGIFSFNLGSMDPHSVSRMLNQTKNICTRSGAHCNHSWFNSKGSKGSVRASVYLYNTEEEVKTFVFEVKKINKML